MVRVNLITPDALADQHLVAEYRELMTLLGYVRNYPQPVDIPTEFTLGKGHIKFFKDKLMYLKKRHRVLRREMRARGFQTNHRLRVGDLPTQLHNDWTPTAAAILEVKSRIIQRLREKDNWYRYHGELVDIDFLVGKIEDA